MFKTKSKLLCVVFAIILLFTTTVGATEPVDQLIDQNDTDIDTLNSTEFSDTDIVEQNANDALNGDEQLHNKDFIASGNDIIVDQLIDGNAFIFGNNVSITGEIGGDLFVMARVVDISNAYVYGNVFVIADKVTINATVYDIYAFCNELELKYDGIVYRDLKVTANTKITIDGRVGRNVTATTKLLSISENVLIYGDLNYTAKEATTIPEGVVTGSINYEKSKIDVGEYVINLIAELILVAVIFTLLFKLSPKCVKRINNFSFINMLVALGIGVVSIILVPIVATLLIITVVGSSLSASLLIAYSLALVVSFVFASMSIASFINRKNNSFGKSLLFVLATAIVLWLLTKIPYAGFFINIILLVYGFGVFVLTLCTKTKKAKLETENN